MAFKMKGFSGFKSNGDTDPKDKDPEKYPGPDLSNLKGTRGTISELPEWEPSRDELLDLMDEAHDEFDKSKRSSIGPGGTGGYRPSQAYTDSVVQGGKDKASIAKEMWKKMGYDKE